jgi:uncharacterized membrane protein YkvA (DUF1232 family)
MKLFRLLPLLFGRFRSEAKMVWGMLTNSATPPAAKLAAILALAYLVSPIDLIPDFIPVLGWLDDGAVVAVLISVAYKLLPAQLYAQLRAKAGGAVPTKRRAPAGKWTGRKDEPVDVTPH